MAFVAGALAFYAFCFSPPEYSLRGVVGVIYPTCTLIWSILSYLPTILSLIDLLGITLAHYDIIMNSPMTSFSQQEKLSLLLQSGTITGIPSSNTEHLWGDLSVINAPSF